VETDDGLSIFKVTEKEPEILKTLDEVRERITGILKDQKARQMADEKILKLEKAAKKEKDLESACQKLGYASQSTGLLKDGDPIQDIDTSGSLSRGLFGLEVNGISSPLYTYKGVGLAQLKKIEAPRPAGFDEVRDQVEEAVSITRKKEMALERMTTARDRLAREDIDKLAEQFEMEYKTAEEHKRGQYLYVIGENEEIDRLAFSLPYNQASDPVEFDKGYALIRIIDRKEVTREDFEGKRDAETEKLLDEKKNQFFQSYLYKVRQDLGVRIRYDTFLKINSDILSRFEKAEE
jgi:parvulin-like peptidyl-prolyl isomerase